jgi:hypothetical protein
MTPAQICDLSTTWFVSSRIGLFGTWLDVYRGALRHEDRALQFGLQF